MQRSLVGFLPDASVTAPKLSGTQTGAASIYGVRAWVNFNGIATIAIRGSGNVSSVTDLGSGNYRIAFTTPLPSANYAVVVTSSGDGASPSTCYEANTGNNRVSAAASSIDIQLVNSAGTPTTRASVNVMVLG